MGVAVHWFRKDLRLDDNPALATACGEGWEVFPLFIWDPGSEGAAAPGAAARWWLHHALTDLAAAIERSGGRLCVAVGDPLSVLRRIVRETGATAVTWNRRYEPPVVERDRAIKRALAEDGLTVRSENAGLLFEPWEVCTKAGDPYRVYTPFARTARQQGFVRPVALEAGAIRWNRQAVDDALDVAALGLLPRIGWDAGLAEAWTPTRAAGLARMRAFLDGPVETYDRQRDLPAEDGTSRLSPYLHWGQIGPREAVAALGGGAVRGGGREVFLNELLWREFAHHVLFHFPHTMEAPLQEGFAHFPWERDEALLEAWRRGRTGYPLVDAGMRQLWATGWMHNRVRMVVGSLLVKHLLQGWRDGAEWFWDTLVDADLANNTLGWQWIGGCGADAAPYFRVFNPVTQGTKFDPGRGYVRRWVPELARLPDKYLHAPWEAPANVLEWAGVELGETYPRPVVEHAAGRERALAAFQQMKEARDA